MRIVFVGGVQGVGKSTLLDWLSKAFDGLVKIINPGELFRLYFYKTKLKSLEEIEEMVIKEILDSPDDSLVVTHWHYAVKRSRGYIPQISFARLRTLARSGKIERALFLSVEAAEDEILRRRLNDYGQKKRGLSRDEIKREIMTDRKFLSMHWKTFVEVIGKSRVSVLRLNNTKLEKTKRRLRAIINDLFI